MAELSGFEVLALLKEIDLALRGSYVNNIYRMGTSQLFRLRKTEGPDAWLVVSPKKGVWLSEAVSEREETNEFTTKLRAEFERARFVGASQLDLDRVFELDFLGGARRRLIVELMPPGNIIVVDAEGRIVLSLVEVRSPGRRVVKGELYRPPAQSRRSPAEVGADDVRGMWGKEKTAGRAIGRHVALPRKYVSECLARLGLTDESPSASLQGREDGVVDVLRSMVEEAKLSPKPSLCRVNGVEDIYVIPPRGAEPVFSSAAVSEICDRVFLKEAGEEEAPPSAEAARKKELEVTVSRLRSEAEMLTTRAGKVRADAGVAGAGSVEEARAVLAGAGIELAREPSSPSAIASALFDYAKSLERKSEESLAAAAKLEKRLAKIGPPAPRKTTHLQRRRQEWFERFRWFVTSGGRLAVGGRDAQSNSLLIRRHLEDQDVVYHADLFGSPFFILKEGRHQSEQEALELAQATVSFSSGWKTGLGAADAYWVLKDQLSASPESGEYLAKGSFVVRGRKNFVRHALLQVAVGVDGDGRVVAGPESAVARACQRYLVLIPHREKQSDTAKKVLKELIPQDNRAANLDDFVRALPPGGGKIVRRKDSGPLRDKP